MKNKKGLYIAIAGLFAIVVIVRVSYAYLPTDDLPNEPQDAEASTATLKLKYTDCASENQADCADITADLEPGQSITKTFEVKNVGTKEVTYDIYFRELNSSFKNDELVYTLENMATGESLIARTAVLEGSNTNIAIKRKIVAPVGSAARYKLTVTFLNKDYEQSDNYDASFDMKIKIAEHQNSPSENTLAHLKVTPTTATPNFDEPATSDEGVFQMEDDYGTSYYYRGAVENNYVKFAGFYWRIIRVNGDGSLRIIYDGTQAWPNGNGASTFTTSGTDRFTHTGQKYNTNYNDNKYVGWMYGPAGTTASTSKAQAQTNTASSDIKTVVDAWYKTNIVDKGYGSAVADVIFCNDRSTPGKTATGWSSDTGLGYGTNATAFGTIARYGWSGTAGYDNPKPQFTCPQKNDAFTVSDTSKGNGALTYPVGLITGDEIVAAGSGKYNTVNRHYYLYKTSGYWYWSLSPYNFYGSRASVFYVYSNGYLSDIYVGGTGAVAPVINLSADYVATLSGTGTMSDPYTSE